jgi:hypothetical protein
VSLYGDPGRSLWDIAVRTVRRKKKAINVSDQQNQAQSAVTFTQGGSFSGSIYPTYGDYGGNQSATSSGYNLPYGVWPSTSGGVVTTLIGGSLPGLVGTIPAPEMNLEVFKVMLEEIAAKVKQATPKEEKKAEPSIFEEDSKRYIEV